MVRAILVFSQDDIWLGLMDGLAHWDGGGALDFIHPAGVGKTSHPR